MSVKRTPEPELMNNPLQVKAYAEADFSKGDSFFVDELEKNLKLSRRLPNSSTRIFDLGCGPGNVTERLALRWPFATVLGLDGAEEMIALARKRKDSLGEINRRLFYRCLNLKQISDGSFVEDLSAEMLVSNSLLHHFHEPIHFWKSVKGLAKPGGFLFLRDLRRPSSRDSAKALQEKYLPMSPMILIRDYLASLHASFTVDEVKIQLAQSDLTGLTVTEFSDCYLEVFGTID